MRQQLTEQAGRFEREMEAARAKAEALSQKLDAEREARQTEHERAEEAAAGLKAENARLQERAGYVDELRAQVKALQDRLAAPANQNEPEAPARASRTRKKGGEQSAGAG